jgi:hypothetical protein
MTKPLIPHVPTRRLPAFVADLRVSTDRRGKSGLGPEAQRAAVARRIAGAGGLAVEFVEVESGRKARPPFAAAPAACRAHRATLVAAKLDHPARNAGFLLSIAGRTSEGGVTFGDLPQVPPEGASSSSPCWPRSPSLRPG